MMQKKARAVKCGVGFVNDPPQGWEKFADKTISADYAVSRLR